MDLSFLHLGGPSYTAFSVGRLVDLRFLIIMANRPGLAQLKNAKHCNLHNGMLLCHHALCNLAAAVQAAVFNVYFFCFCCRYCLLKCSIIVFWAEQPLGESYINILNKNAKTSIREHRKGCVQRGGRIYEIEIHIKERKSNIRTSRIEQKNIQMEMQTVAPSSPKHIAQCMLQNCIHPIAQDAKFGMFQSKHSWVISERQWRNNNRHLKRKNRKI